MSTTPDARPAGAPPLTDTMKTFWDEKAREDAHFYIATWTGYRREHAAEFFEPSAAIAERLGALGYIPPAGARMLEIGCGIGRMTRGFAELFAEVDAIDVAPEMVRQARANLADCTHVRVHESNGVDLGLFPAATFDFVFSYIVFQHFPDFAVTRSYILEAARVLKPGGTFLFQVNNVPPPREYHSPLLRQLSRLWRRYGLHLLLEAQARLTRGPRGFDHPAWMGHRVRVPELREALAAAGLTEVAMSGRGTAYLWVRARRPAAA